MKVKKTTGTTDAFSIEKLRNSLLRAGANEVVAAEVIEQIQQDFYDGITTKVIYQTAFRLMKKQSNALAARYNLKRGIQELGPSGYPFEHFIGEIFKFRGYNVQVGTMVKGNCLQHEVDVLAETEGKRVVIECKFRNRPVMKIDVKIPLYMNARFQDISRHWQKEETTPTQHYVAIITNTRFTTDAILYGKCSNMELIGWDYPHQGNLKDLIEISGLYPVTCLTSITNAQKQALLKDSIVIAKELYLNQDKIEHLHLNRKAKYKLQKELEELAISK